MSRLADRVKETASTTGTGTVTLAGPVAGFRAFLATLGAGGVYYAIVHQSLAEWEVGNGTLAASPDTLARTSVLSSSNAGAPVNFSAGLKDVFCTAPASILIYTPPAVTAERIIATAYPTALTNTTTETTILSAAVPSVAATSELRFECDGDTNIAASQAMGATWRVKLDGTTIASLATSTAGMVTGQTAFWVHAIIKNRNSQSIQRVTLRYHGVSGAATALDLPVIMGFGTAALNWASSRTVAVTVQLTAATSTLTFGPAVLYQTGA